MDISVKILHRAIKMEDDENKNLSLVVVPYRVAGVDNEVDARTALHNNIPNQYLGLNLARVTLLSRMNEYNWEFEVEYNKDIGEMFDNDTEDTDPIISYSIRSRPVTRKKAIQRIDFKLRDGVESLPEISGSTDINLDSNGSVRGVEVSEGELLFQLTYYHRRSKITPTYIKAVRALAGQVNNADFKGFEAGELKFDGIDTSYREGENGRVPITYNFTFSPNVINYPLFDGLTVTKYGWDYLWFYTQRQTVGKNTEEERTVETVLAAVLDRVVFYSNFSALGI